VRVGQKAALEELLALIRAGQDRDGDGACGETNTRRLDESRFCWPIRRGHRCVPSSRLSLEQVLVLPREERAMRRFARRES
jgi:hypothetical protein